MTVDFGLKIGLEGEKYQFSKLLHETKKLLKKPYCCNSADNLQTFIPSHPEVRMIII